MVDELFHVEHGTARLSQRFQEKEGDGEADSFVRRGVQAPLADWRSITSEQRSFYG